MSPEEFATKNNGTIRSGIIHFKHAWVTFISMVTFGNDETSIYLVLGLLENEKLNEFETRANLILPVNRIIDLEFEYNLFLTALANIRKNSGKEPFPLF